MRKYFEQHCKTQVTAKTAFKKPSVLTKQPSVQPKRDDSQENDPAATLSRLCRA